MSEQNPKLGKEYLHPSFIRIEEKLIFPCSGEVP